MFHMFLSRVFSGIAYDRCDARSAGEARPFVLTVADRHTGRRRPNVSAFGRRMRTARAAALPADTSCHHERSERSPSPARASGTDALRQRRISPERTGRRHGAVIAAVEASERADVGAHRTDLVAGDRRDARVSDPVAATVAATVAVAAPPVVPVAAPDEEGAVRIRCVERPTAADQTPVRVRAVALPRGGEVVRATRGS